MRNKFVPRDEQKSTALHRVLDVIARLYDGYHAVDEQKIAYPANPLGAEALRLARRDALLLHAQMLIVFYEMSLADRAALDSGADNVIAEDYDFEAHELEIDEDTRARIVEVVTELTYGRAADPAAAWDLAAIALPLLKRSSEFMSPTQGQIARGSALSLRWDFYRMQIGKQLKLDTT